MFHEHLKFFNNSSNNNAQTNGKVARTGDSFIPHLSADRTSENESKLAESENVKKSATEKQVDIIEYLKSLRADQEATNVDILRELGIDLNKDLKVLSMIKSNPKVELYYNDDVMSLKYRSRFTITNKKELLENIDRVASGIVLSEILDCYEDLEEDVMEMINCGRIIGVKNKDLKSIVLFPRGDPFYSKLTGNVTAMPGAQDLQTTSDLSVEIRRGEALCVGKSWYRVSPAVTASAGSGNISTRSAGLKPTSVSIEKDITDKNEFALPFTSKILPMDADFEGYSRYTGIAMRHGVTTDLRDLYFSTVPALQEFKDSEMQCNNQKLHDKLIELNLIPPTARLNNQEFEDKASVRRQQIREQQATNKLLRKIRKPRDPNMVNNKSNNGIGVNAHLRGTALEKILKETREKAYHDDIRRLMQQRDNLLNNPK